MLLGGGASGILSIFPGAEPAQPVLHDLDRPGRRADHPPALPDQSRAAPRRRPAGRRPERPCRRRHLRRPQLHLHCRAHPGKAGDDDRFGPGHGALSRRRPGRRHGRRPVQGHDGPGHRPVPAAGHRRRGARRPGRPQASAPGRQTNADEQGPRHRQPLFRQRPHRQALGNDQGRPARRISANSSSVSPKSRARPRRSPASCSGTASTCSSASAATAR